MKWSEKDRFLTGWILILVLCTLIGIIYEIVFADSQRKDNIQSGIESNHQEDYFSEPGLLHSAFDSVRREHLNSREINHDSIINY